MTSHSQHGEDLELLNVFAGQSAGVCVEVGAYDGVTLSNTLLFERMGWTVILVEPNPAFEKVIRRQRRARLFVCAAGCQEGELVLTVPPGEETLASMSNNPRHLRRIKADAGQFKRVRIQVRRLDDILREAGVKQVSFLTIDVEGSEYEVLRGFTPALWNPRVIILEENGYGYLQKIDRYLGRAGYICFQRTGCNEWYARQDDPLATAEKVRLQRKRHRKRYWTDLRRKAGMALGLYKLKSSELRFRAAKRWVLKHFRSS